MDYKEGKYTYANSENTRWVNELFENPEEAVDKASEMYESFLIGQLQRVGYDYRIINVIEFSEIK